MANGPVWKGNIIMKRIAAFLLIVSALISSIRCLAQTGQSTPADTVDLNKDIASVETALRNKGLSEEDIARVIQVGNMLIEEIKKIDFSKMSTEEIQAVKDGYNAIFEKMTSFSPHALFEDLGTAVPGPAVTTIHLPTAMPSFNEETLLKEGKTKQEIVKIKVTTQVIGEWIKKVDWKSLEEEEALRLINGLEECFQEFAGCSSVEVFGEYPDRESDKESRKSGNISQINAASGPGEDIFPETVSVFSRFYAQKPLEQEVPARENASQGQKTTDTIRKESEAGNSIPRSVDKTSPVFGVIITLVLVSGAIVLVVLRKQKKKSL